MNKEKLILVPPRELPLFTRPVGPTIPISARFGARSIHWNWHPDDKGVWHEGVICDTCNEVFNISNPKSLCKCGKRNGLGWHKGVDFASPCGTIVFLRFPDELKRPDGKTKTIKAKDLVFVYACRSRSETSCGNCGLAT